MGYVNLIDSFIYGEIHYFSLFFRDEFIVDVPLYSDPSGKSIGRCDTEKGKPAKTKFKILFQNENNTLVLCRPITGRTHQIRIHLYHIGYPIVGDPLYKISTNSTQQGNNSNSSKSYLDDPTQSFNSPEYNNEIDKICLKCKEMPPDIPTEALFMCLHSVLYTGDGWKFFAELPFWVHDLMTTDEVKTKIKEFQDTDKE